MAGAAGRIIRVVAGIALIVIGLVVVQGVGGWVLAIVGLAPLIAGIADVCLFAPLFGGPFQGKEARKG